MVLEGKSSQEYPVNGVPQGFVLGPTLFQPYINDLPDDFICNIAIYADDTTLYSKYDQASDLWQQVELASELESDLQGIVKWGRKWFVDFNAGKTQLVSFDCSRNTGAIDVKMNDDDDDDEWWWWWWIVCCGMVDQWKAFSLISKQDKWVTFARDPHHHEPLTCCEQDLNLSRTWVQALMNEVIK